MKASERIEALFPKETRVDFRNNLLMVYTKRNADVGSNLTVIPTEQASLIESEIVFVPMAIYLKALVALDLAEAAIRILEAGLESTG